MEHSEPVQESTRRRKVALATAALTVAVAGVLAGGVALAATGSAPSRPSAGMMLDDRGDVRSHMGRGFGKGLGHGPGMMGRMGRMGPMGGLHGEFVGRDGSGGFQTYLTQSGEVTAVGAGSVTVKSEDGYTHTYAVSATSVVDAGRDGIGDVKVGDTVHLMASRSGGEDTVVHLADLTRLKATWRDLT